MFTAGVVMGWGKLKSDVLEEPADRKAANVSWAEEGDPASKPESFGDGLPDSSISEPIPRSPESLSGTFGEGLDEESDEESFVRGDNHYLVSILDYYDALDQDSELHMAEAARTDYARLCNRSSRAWASEVASSRLMMWTLTLVIVFDICVSINREPNREMSSGFDDFAHGLDLFTVCIFTLEALLRMYAMTFRGYVSQGFNQLDLVVVVLSWPAIIFEEFNVDVGPLRAFRVLSVLKEIRFLSSLQVTRAPPSVHTLL